MDCNVNKKDENDIVDEMLHEFNVSDNAIITPGLNLLIEKIATTGLTRFPWEKIKKLIAVKLEEVITEFNKRIPVVSSTLGGVNTDDVAFEDMKLRLIENINAFYGAPFTVQRLCELMTNPTKHYKTTEKFMRAIEKNLLVVSTVDPCGNKILNEPRRTLQDVEPDSSESLQNQPQVERSPFLAPASPVIDIRTSSVPRFTVVRAPSVFNSPSLRGIATSVVSNQSCLLPFHTDTVSRKRRRTNFDSIEEKAGDLPYSATGFKSSETLDRCDEEQRSASTLLLGGLLSGGEEHELNADDKEGLAHKLDLSLPLCGEEDVTSDLDRVEPCEVTLVDSERAAQVLADHRVEPCEVALVDSERAAQEPEAQGGSFTDNSLGELVADQMPHTDEELDTAHDFSNEPLP